MPKTTALNRIPWTRVARVTATGTRTTTSATYVDIPTDTVALASLVKKRSDTNLVITVEGSWYHTTSGNRLTVGVNFNSTDYDIAARFANELSSHKTFAGSREISGVAAGTYTFTMRVKVGGGQYNIASGDNTNCLTVSEVMPS